MKKDPIVEKCVDAIAKGIADDLRRALAEQPRLTREQIRGQMLQTIAGSIDVIDGPDDPNCVIVTWQPPKQIVLEITLPPDVLDS